mmetsp:Transcript_27254/g.57332  ORF Transcript_27254/g.57332 Transcript_27254/m.57332 type:complete len:414 (+) Transcript_27254:45-1286(+)
MPTISKISFHQHTIYLARHRLTMKFSLAASLLLAIGSFASAHSFSSSINVSIDSEIKKEIEECLDDCAEIVTDGSKGRSSSRFMKRSKGFASGTKSDKTIKASKGGETKDIADDIDECNLECFLDDTGTPNSRARAIGNDDLITLGECTSTCASDAEHDLSKGYNDADKDYDDCEDQCADDDKDCEKKCDKDLENTYEDVEDKVEHDLEKCNEKCVKELTGEMNQKSFIAVVKKITEESPSLRTEKKKSSRTVVQNDIINCFDGCSESVIEKNKDISKGKLNKIQDDLNDCNAECFIDSATRSPNRLARSVGTEGLMELGECVDKCSSTAEKTVKNDIKNIETQNKKDIDDCIKNDCDKDGEDYKTCKKVCEKENKLDKDAYDSTSKSVREDNEKCNSKCVDKISAALFVQIA